MRQQCQAAPHTETSIELHLPSLAWHNLYHSGGISGQLVVTSSNSCVCCLYLLGTLRIHMPDFIVEQAQHAEQTVAAEVMAAMEAKAELEQARGREVEGELERQHMAVLWGEEREASERLQQTLEVPQLMTMETMENR